MLNSSIEFVKSTSEFLPELFLSNHKLSEKLANVLNYSLDNFATKKFFNVKVKNMQSYNFDPKYILKSLIEIYISFAKFTQFLEFVIRDERSFKIETFERVIQMREKETFKIDVNKFQSYIELVKKINNLYLEYKRKEVNLI